MPYTPPGSQSVLVLQPSSSTSVLKLHPPSALFEPISRIPPTSTTTSVQSSTLQRPPTALRLNLGQHANIIKSNSRKAQTGFDSSNSVEFPLTPLEGSGSTHHRRSSDVLPQPLIAPPPPIRKKSGELVKPSLKTSSSYRSSSYSAPPSPGITLSTLSTIGDGTPTPSKMVHFDAQLEHVKLFKSEQKPAAVSRDGSPELTTDTEGEDGSGVEYFGYKMPKIAGQRARANSVSQVGSNGSRLRVIGQNSVEEESLAKRVFTNFLNFSCASSLPTSGPISDSYSFNTSIHPRNVSLGSLELRYCSSNTTSSPDAALPALGLEGSILVKNIAFDKKVAIRFTLDDWQTVSEVGARWERSVDVLPMGSPLLGVGSALSGDMGAGFAQAREGRATKGSTPVSADLFSFSIKLSDHLLRIATKTLMFCIRFTAAGSEWWDNNHNSNYIVKFGVKEQSPSQQPGSARSNYLGLSTRGKFGIEGLPSSPEPEDLRKRLDRLASPDAENVKQKEIDAKTSTIPFPAPMDDKQHADTGKETNVSAWLKSQSKFAVPVDSKGGGQAKLPQRRAENRRAFTFPNAQVPAAISSATAKVSAVTSVSNSDSTSSSNEDIFASFGPYSSSGTESPTRSKRFAEQQLFTSTSFPSGAFMNGSGTSNAVRGSPRDWEHHHEHESTAARQKAMQLITPPLGHDIVSKDDGLPGAKSGFASRRRHHQRSSYFDGWSGPPSAMEKSNVKRTPPGTPDQSDSQFGPQVTDDSEVEELALCASPISAEDARSVTPLAIQEVEYEEPLSVGSSSSGETVTLEGHLKSFEERELDSPQSNESERLEISPIYSGLHTPSLDSNSESSTTVSSPITELSNDEFILEITKNSSIINGSLGANLGGLFPSGSSLFGESSELSGEERRRQYSAFVDQFCFFTGLCKAEGNEGIVSGQSSSNISTPTGSGAFKAGVVNHYSSYKHPATLSSGRRTQSDSSVVNSFFSSGTATPPLSHWTAASSNLGEIITSQYPRLATMAPASARS